MFLWYILPFSVIYYGKITSNDFDVFISEIGKALLCTGGIGLKFGPYFPNFSQKTGCSDTELTKS